MKRCKFDLQLTGIQIGKKGLRVFFFEDDIILYIKDLKEFTKNFIQLINTLSKEAGYKINSVAF